MFDLFILMYVSFRNTAAMSQPPSGNDHGRFIFDLKTANASSEKHVVNKKENKEVGKFGAVIIYHTYSRVTNNVYVLSN